MRPDPPGRLDNADRDRVARLWAQARAGHGWAEVADLLVRLRAAGVPVVSLAAAAGVNQERLRAVCRKHGPPPATLGDPLTAAGWVTTPTGAVLLGVSRRRLQDSSPKAIAAGVCVSGNTVTQVVDTSNTAITYPVVADPFLWRDLISSARWAYHTEGWTLMVTPTGWARFNAGSYGVGKLDWNELYAKYRNSGLNTNLDGMRDQLICHQQIVAIRSPRKPTWNLDEWRPDVSYASTVNASCNPGGSRWFD